MEALVLNTYNVLVRSVFKLWLSDRRDQHDRTSPLSELLAGPGSAGDINDGLPQDPRHRNRRGRPRPACPGDLRNPSTAKPIRSSTGR